MAAPSHRQMAGDAQVPAPDFHEERIAPCRPHRREVPDRPDEEPEQPEPKAEADRARVSGDRENAYFEGSVRATREAETAGEDPAGPITLTTEFLHVIPKQDRAQTDRPVTIEEPRGIIHADGLVLDNEAKTLRLRSNVKGTIQPPAPG